MALKMGINFTKDLFFTEFLKLFLPGLKVAEFHCGTIDGLYVMRNDIYEIIAVYNNEPHNGDFDKFLTELEALSEKTNKEVVMRSFLSERLYNSMKKRAGWHVLKEDKEDLIYIPKGLKK